MNSTPLKVIYIAGAGRSGSTLLSNILGQMPGVVSVGELYYLWERGLQENILCGCGTPFRDCAYWQEILDRTALKMDKKSGVSSGSMDIDRLDVGQMFANGINGARTRHIPYLFSKNGRRRFSADSKPFIELLGHMFDAIKEVTGCGCVIDASKFPTFGYLLTQLPNAEVCIIHLIRDPRAVGFSWQRRKFNPDSGELFGRMSIPRSAAIWDSWNIGAEILGRTLQHRERYLRLQYESFIQEPLESLARIIRLANLEIEPDSVVRDNTVSITQEHTIAGNPIRFNKNMKLQLDMDWRTAMPANQQLATTAITWPLLWRYGYPIR